MRYYFLLALLLLVPFVTAMDTNASTGNETNELLDESNSSNDTIVGSDVIFNEPVASKNDNETNDSIVGEISEGLVNNSETNNSQDVTTVTDPIDDDSGDNGGATDQTPTFEPVTDQTSEPTQISSLPEVRLPTVSFAMQDVIASERCTTKRFESTEAIMGMCERLRYSCNVDNTSCTETVEEYECKVGLRPVIHVVDECFPTSFTIFDTYELPQDEYACELSRTGGRIIAICDSKRDGNGDGICHDGESCLRYEFTRSSVTREMKNSQQGFSQSDTSFFLDEALVEVRT